MTGRLTSFLGGGDGPGGLQPRRGTPDRPRGVGEPGPQRDGSQLSPGQQMMRRDDDGTTLLRTRAEGDGKYDGLRPETKAYLEQLAGLGKVQDGPPGSMAASQGMDVSRPGPRKPEWTRNSYPGDHEPGVNEGVLGHPNIGSNPDLYRDCNGNAFLAADRSGLDASQKRRPAEPVPSRYSTSNPGYGPVQNGKGEMIGHFIIPGTNTRRVVSNNSSWVEEVPRDS